MWKRRDDSCDGPVFARFTDQGVARGARIQPSKLAGVTGPLADDGAPFRRRGALILLTRS
jgi:hypothetical protein